MFKRHPILRRLAALALAAVCCVLFFHWSNTAIQTERFTFASPRLPEHFDGFTIVLLSDLHGAVFGEDNAPLLEAVAQAEPDLIAVTGDILDRFRETPVSYAAHLGSQLSAIAPTYFVTGNHDWAMGTAVAEELKDALCQSGVTVLNNDTLALWQGDEHILLSGIDDPNGYADQKSPAQVADELLAAYGENDFRLLLAHRNDRFAREYAPLGYDLTLSGHGHGGLIRLPFTDGLLGTNHDFFPTFTAGFYTVDGAEVLVSRGLGNSGPSFRLFNRPEVAALTLRRSDS